MACIITSIFSFNGLNSSDGKPTSACGWEQRSEETQSNVRQILHSALFRLLIDQLKSIQDPWVQSMVFSQSKSFISSKDANIGSKGTPASREPTCSCCEGSRTWSRTRLTTFLSRWASSKFPSVGRTHSRKATKRVSFWMASDRENWAELWPRDLFRSSTHITPAAGMP